MTNPVLRLAPFAPLLVHVLPTLAIGFGIVIPNSPIAGWNVYSVGFLTAVLGFIPAYLAGIGLARRVPRQH